MTPENPSAQVPKAEEAQRINEALGADCLHGHMKRDGDDMPVKAWDCYGCTARIVSEMLTAAREEASREAARDVCHSCDKGTCDHGAWSCPAYPIWARLAKGGKANG